MSDHVLEHRAHLRRASLIEKSVARTLVVPDQLKGVDDTASRITPSCPIPIENTKNLQASHVHVFRHPSLYHRCNECGREISSTAITTTHGSYVGNSDHRKDGDSQIEGSAVWFPSLGQNPWVTLCAACTSGLSSSPM